MESTEVLNTILQADEYKVFRAIFIFIALFVPGMAYQYFLINVVPIELFGLLNFLLKSFIFSIPFLLLGAMMRHY